MALPITPTYVTQAEFEAYTRNSAYIGLLPADFNRAALYAEQVVDAYVGHTNKCDCDQVMKFPIYDCDCCNPCYSACCCGATCEIPNDVKLATIEIITEVLNIGDVTSPTKDNYSSNSTSEEWSDSSYRRSSGASSGGSSSPDYQPINFPIPPIAMRLLRRWHGATAGLKY